MLPYTTCQERFRVIPGYLRIDQRDVSTHTHTALAFCRDKSRITTRRTHTHNRLPYIYVHNKNTFSVRQHNSSVSARARARLNQDVSSPVPAFGARPATDGFARTAHHHHHQSPDDCEQREHSIYSYFHWMYNSTLDNRNRWCVFGWSGGGPCDTFRTAHRARMVSECIHFVSCTCLQFAQHLSCSHTLALNGGGGGGAPGKYINN